MKTRKIISTIFKFMLTIVLFFTFSALQAQTDHKKTVMHKQHMMKDCCMMMEGKMMVMKNGKTMPMDKDMVMKNGTTCMANGECIMKDGTKMTMKNGDCMDMNGKMCNDKMKMKSTKKQVSDVYTCPMHPEVAGIKGGKCPKCGMNLVVKNK